MRLKTVLFSTLIAGNFANVMGSAADSVKSESESPKVSSDSKDPEYKDATFPIGPFTKYSDNPIMKPDPSHKFEEAHLYNPTAIVLDDKVFLLYRAQDKELESSIGLAWSDDGYHFTKLDHPIVNATEAWEEGGGTEDPRIVRKDGKFYLTYTGYNKKLAQLCLATSDDLLNWKKYPPILPSHYDIPFGPNNIPTVQLNHSKSGAIIAKKDKNGSYNMIFGNSQLHLAKSKDLIHWEEPNVNKQWAAGVHWWENMLIESGPAPVKAKGPGNQYIFVYNTATLGNAQFANQQYSTGQMLIDYDNIDDGPIARVEQPILTVTEENEQNGLVNNVVFSEGLVQFKDKWFLYFGQGDSDLGVATAPVV